MSAKTLYFAAWQILGYSHGYSSTFPDRALFTAITPGFQVAPKRCGHTIGKSVVDRDEAYRRVKVMA